jgi:hypothetical protein
MDDLKKLRKRVAEEQRRGCGQRGKRYSVELRRDVSAYLCAARARGVSPNRLGRALGLTLPTAYQWSVSPKKKEKGKVKPFRRMTIVAQPAARDETTVGTNQIVVTGPGGLRAAGLGVPELAELLRRLGC